jgi:hypothetical protein
MRFFPRPARIGRRWLLALVVVAGLAAFVIWYVWPDSAALDEWSRQYDVTTSRPDLIPPGTVMDDTPPPGWSRLVVKSHPKIAPEYLNHVNSLTARKASVIFAAVLADVRPADDGRPPRHRLRSVAVGLGIQVKGQDMILSPDTLSTLGSDLDVIDRTVLGEAYERQLRAKLLIRSPLFALVDAPVPFRCGTKNRYIAYRYAFLVDEKTGQLDVLLWGLDASGQCAQQVSVVRRLPPNLITEPPLYVDDDQINALGLPSETAFGVGRMPDGDAQFTPPPELRSLAVQKEKFEPHDAQRLEKELRRLLKQQH